MGYEQAIRAKHTLKNLLKFGIELDKRRHVWTVSERKLFLLQMLWLGDKRLVLKKA